MPPRMSNERSKYEDEDDGSETLERGKEWVLIGILDANDLILCRELGDNQYDSKKNISNGFGDQ